MSVIRVGSTGKYADGWDLVFGKVAGRKAAAGTTSAGKGGKKAVAAAKKSAKSVKAKVLTKRSKVRRGRRG
ncbi:MAG: hypothetical protein DWI03_08630 [Planctomycetota bacterium]|nr:MAG: hypothetical protein DWI03_08630 [Planctomycetota bacterium]